MTGSCVGGDCPTAIQFTLGGQPGVLVQGEAIIGGEQARAANALGQAGVGTSDTETQVWMTTEDFVNVVDRLIDEGRLRTNGDGRLYIVGS